VESPRDQTGNYRRAHFLIVGSAGRRLKFGSAPDWSAEAANGKGDRLSEGGAPPGWYPDPGGGGQRYFDGSAWTGHTVPWAAAPAAPYGYGWGAPPWKGARYGRPALGPGSLAEPGSRLAARLLDGLIFLPAFILVAALALALVAPHAGPMFPKENVDPNASVPTPGFVWLYLAFAGAALLSGALFVVYEAVATARCGRTLGKRWMSIRPITLEGDALGWGRSFGRAAVQWIASFMSWLGLLDALWCVWDADRQCVHDKIAGTLVVND
jgi:uncharacterized RDD family membrane protein YckC